MNADTNDIDMERVRMNVVGETKKIILEDDQDCEKNIDPEHVSDDEIRKALEMLNPDPHSLKSRG